MSWKVTDQGEDLWTSGSNGSEGSFTSFIEWTNTDTGAVLFWEQDYRIYGDVTLVSTGERVGDEPFFGDVNDNYAKAMLDYARTGALLGEHPVRNYWLLPGQWSVCREITYANGTKTAIESVDFGDAEVVLDLRYHGRAEQCESLDTAIRFALAGERRKTIEFSIDDANLNEWLIATSGQ